MSGAVWYLKQCDLFERLSEAEAAQLNRRALARTFARGELVYSPHQPGESVLVLATGRVKIHDLTLEGRETILAFIEEGELFGELALFDEGARHEYAEAVEPSQVLALPRDDLTALMEARPDIAMSVTKLIGLRRRRIETRLRNLLFLPSRARVVHILLELADAHGDRVGDRVELRFPLAHHDMIGVTRETATLALGQLQGDRLVEVRRKRIVILDLPRLRAEAHAPAPAGAVPR
jgi:CRP/FNR family transcriptional regulator, cyclic AMP receptor protein